MSAAILCRDVVKVYRTRRALDGVSFEVAPGEIVALLGPNGAGKSTTLSIIATLLEQTSGHVEVAGHTLPAGARLARRSLGLVPQRAAVYPALTARENLAYFAPLQGLDHRAARAAIARVLALVGLESRADEPVAQYSGGMARRLNLACGILHGPRVVLLDEPTVGVDPQARERIYALERSLAAEGGAILHSTHLMEEAQRLCDRVILLDGGRVIASGTPTELVSRLGLRPVLTLHTERPLPAGWPGTGVRARATSATAERIVLQIDEVGLVPALLDRARADGGEILDVALHRPDLADVFFHLTGHELRDGDTGEDPTP
ncbi:MAG TPA: ABC transporter ATP-binding protein [Candidatus Eisenbacteria bacterium]|nr:ABC transporter ATP-binding protein [Candidatus Eisenbacteria bacterium]